MSMGTERGTQIATERARGRENVSESETTQGAKEKEVTAQSWKERGVIHQGN
jgi:hypothetical protein